MSNYSKIFAIFLLDFFTAGILGDFEADVRWTCSEDLVSIFVRTPLPFEGLVQTRPNTSGPPVPEACKIQGFGTNVAVLKLNLKSEECGVVYNKETKTHHVMVDVHSHPVLIVKGDKSVNITCRDVANDTNQWAKMSDDHSLSDYQLRILSSRFPVESVKYSQPYTIQVRPLPSRQPNPLSFFVGQCTAQPIAGNVTVQLTDAVGCALFQSIMSNFARRESVEEAEIPSMFRFPNAKQLRISCVVIECEGKCEQRSCNSVDSSASALLERTTASVESDEVQKAWIVVDIDDQNEEQNIVEGREQVQENQDEQVVHVDTRDVDKQSPIPTNLIVKKDKEEPSYSQCVSEYEFTILYYLCIFLAVCSIVGFTMNIVLCILLRRRSKAATLTTKPRNRPAVAVEQLQIPKSTVNPPDFWIDEANKQPEFSYFKRQGSGSSYSSFKNHHQPHQIQAISQRRHIPQEYVVPSARSSAHSSADSNEIYRRPNTQQPPIRPEARHSNSTFITHSTTMETDLDSQGSSSNQASSYH